MAASSLGKEALFFMVFFKVLLSDSVQETNLRDPLTLWTIQSCTSVLGKTASMASGNPLSPSTHAMKMSLTPRFFISVITFSQNLAPSLCSSQIPRTSLSPSKLIPMAR